MILLPLSKIYAINGQAIPSPSEAPPDIEGIQTFAERTDNGLMHKETVAYKRHITVKYDVLTEEEYKKILDLVITDPPTEYFAFKYRDPQKGVTTITCFANKFGGELYSAIYYNGLWRNITFNCVER